MNTEQVKILEKAMRESQRRGLWIGFFVGAVIAGGAGFLIGASMGDTVTIISTAPSIDV